MMVNADESMLVVLRMIWLGWIALVLGGIASVLGGFMLVNVLVVVTTLPVLYDTVEAIPGGQLAIVLGAGPGSQTLTNRLDGAVELWEEGKVDRILVSGGTDGSGYGETDFMYRYLLQHKIPEEVVLVDSYGLRTLDSVQRAKTVYGAERVIVVTQRYHAYRAVFLARGQGMRVFGFVTGDGEPRYFGSIRLREFFARGMAFIDVFSGRQAAHGAEQMDADERVRWWSRGSVR